MRQIKARLPLLTLTLNSIDCESRKSDSGRKRTGSSSEYTRSFHPQPTPAVATSKTHTPCEYLNSLLHSPSLTNRSTTNIASFISSNTTQRECWWGSESPSTAPKDEERHAHFQFSHNKKHNKATTNWNSLSLARHAISPKQSK